jgi:hypothetical protein
VELKTFLFIFMNVYVFYGLRDVSGFYLGPKYG